MSNIPPESTTKLLLRNKPLLVSQAMAFTSPAGLTTFPVCPACMATLEREGTVDKINVHKTVDKMDKVLHNKISTCANHIIQEDL